MTRFDASHAAQEPHILEAAAIVDAAGTFARPGSVAVRAGRIVLSGPPEAVRHEVGSGCRTHYLGATLVLPALVNAHAHLALTGLGPTPFGGDMSQWLKMVARRRPRGADLAGAVVRGSEQSAAAGVGLLGDIAPAEPEAFEARARGTVAGISFMECFGIGAGEAAAIEQLRADLARLSAALGGRSDISIGLQPHAPYSAGLQLYTSAADLASSEGYRLSTHLAETPAEVQFVRDAKGPFVQLLRDLGKWSSQIKPSGLHPVQWLLPQLRRCRWLLAHCNYVGDEEIDLLAGARACVAYCPVASDYFGHRKHRYRDMLAAGINVCLGTDSMLCQPASGAFAAQPMSMLNQMRYLYERDMTDPMTLLAMATTRGAEALRRDPMDSTLQAGAPGQVIAVRFDEADTAHPLAQVLQNRFPVHPVTVG